MDAPKIKILLLGPPLILIDDKPVKINRRLPRALLYYLAAQVEPSTRPEICAMFWPEIPEENARKNLREVLSLLNKDLKTPGAIQGMNDQLFMDPELVFSDMREFRKIISPLLISPLMTSNDTVPAWLVAQLTQVMSLCRSPHFLQGVHLPGSLGFENWMELTDQTQIVARLKVINRLADYYISIGDLDGAILWLRNGVELDPLNMDMNYLMLSCLRDAGMTKQVIDYVKFLEALYREHDEPFPERFLEISRRAQESIKQGTVEKATTWPEELRSQASFFGREEEMALLNRLLRRKGIVHLRGEAGVGKTRLIQEFFNQQGYSPRVIYTQAHPLAEQVPFRTLVEGVTKTLMPGDLDLLEPHDHELLDQFFHRLLENLETPPFQPTSNGMLPMLEDTFAAFLHLLEKMALSRSLLFVLDNARWCDHASLCLISYLVEHDFFVNFGLMIFITRLYYSNKTLEQLLLNYKRTRKMETITLKGFSSEETGRFFQSLTGIAPYPPSQEKLMLFSGGNPFFLIEGIHKARDARLDLRTAFFSEDNYPTPEPVEALIQEKINTIPSDTYRILQAISVLGSKFSPDILELLVADSHPRYIDAMEELVQVGFINISQAGSITDEYTFCHDLERTYIETRLEPVRRRDLHLRAALAIGKKRGDSIDALRDVATHFEKAGELIEAAGAWLKVGKKAETIFSKIEVYEAFGKALALIESIPSLAPESLIYQVVNEWGNFAYDMDDARTSEDIYKRCIAIGEILQNKPLIGVGNNGLGRAANLVNDYPIAMVYLQRAEYYLSKSDLIVERVKALSRLGNIRFGLDDFAGALQLHKKAVKLGSGVDDPQVIDNQIEIQSYLCSEYCFTGEPRKAVKLAEEMVNDSIRASRRSAQLQAAAVLVMAQYFCGQYDKSVQTFFNSADLSNTIKVRYWISLREIAGASSQLMKGNIDSAWHLIDQADTREAAFRQEKLGMHIDLFKGDFSWYLWDIEKAEENYRNLINNEAKNYQTIRARYSLGLLEAERGNMAEGLAWINEAIQLASEKKLAGVRDHADFIKLIFTAANMNIEEFSSKALDVVNRMIERGDSDAETFRRILKAFKLELVQREDAIPQYEELALYMAGTGSIWGELKILQRIIELADASSKASLAARKRANQLLDLLLSKSTHPAVRGPYQKFRSKWRKFVNDMSTEKVYSYKYKIDA